MAINQVCGRCWDQTVLRLARERIATLLIYLGLSLLRRRLENRIPEHFDRSLSHELDARTLLEESLL